MEMLRRCPLTIAQRLVHRTIALSTAVLDRVTKTMSVAPLLTNNLDNSKQKTSNLLSPAPPPYSWPLLGKSEGPAPPPSSKISWSFDLAWNPELGPMSLTISLCTPLPLVPGSFVLLHTHEYIHDPTLPWPCLQNCVKTHLGLQTIPQVLLNSVCSRLSFSQSQFQAVILPISLCVCI